MDKININSIHISIFRMPIKPYCNCHQCIQGGPNRTEYPIGGLNDGFLVMSTMAIIE